MISASAPGKVILFGEHAVVYGRPALAVPVTQVQATARVERSSGGFWINVPALGHRHQLEEAAPENPLALAVRQVLARAGRSSVPACELTIESTIPIAAGLGSGAAVCTATVRALAGFLDLKLSDAEVSDLVFQTEKLLHGTPSGIDNTVVAFGQPVYFVKGQPPRPFQAAQPVHLLIADTGIPSPTLTTVADVRAGYEREPQRYTRIFDDIGALVELARTHLQAGTPAALGPLMNQNHKLLQALGVSSPELDHLDVTALAAGAAGAKLSGGGRGGNLLALVFPETEPAVRAALEAGGAVRMIGTTIE
jgi:mevalonate kinase